MIDISDPLSRKLQNTKLMHCHCRINNRVLQWTFGKQGWDQVPGRSLYLLLNKNPLWMSVTQQTRISIKRFVIECGVTLYGKYHSHNKGAAVAEWLSSWLAEQEDRGSIPGLATWILRDWLSPASKSRYCWKIAKSTLILKKNNKQTKNSHNTQGQGHNNTLKTHICPWRGCPTLGHYFCESMRYHIIIWLKYCQIS